MKKRSEAAKDKRVDDASRELKEELDRADSEEVATMGGFLSHEHRAKPWYKNQPRLPEDLERVMAGMFKVEFASTHKRLVEGLVIDGASIGDRGTISAALNHAEDFARQAHEVYCVAKLEKERWEADNEVVKGAMWSAATASLQQEKDRGARSKQITDADVRAVAAAMHPDEWKYQETRGVQVKLMVEHMGELLACWRSRCATLRTLLETRR